VTALYEIIPVGSSVSSDPNPFIAETPDHEPVARGGDAMRLRLRYQPLGGGASTLIEADVPAVSEPRTASRDTSWALAMASFARLLANERDPDLDWRTVQRLANAGQGGPDEDRRADTLRLIERAIKFQE
jgi:hypothetical protein